MSVSPFSYTFIFIIHYFKAPLKALDFTLIVIDEAHCVSAWGCDLRNTYREINYVKDMFPNATLLALTSSPSPQVRSDIVRNFKMKLKLMISLPQNLFIKIYILVILW